MSTGTVIINLVGTGAYDHFLEMNGEQFFDDYYGQITCSHGDTITFVLTGMVVLDGDIVFDATGYGVQWYDWNIPSDVSEITIEFFYEDGYGSFYVDTVRVDAPDPSSPHQTLVDGVARSIQSGRCMVNGVGYDIKKGRTLIDGVGYDVAFGPSGMPAGDLAVGTSVFANVDGVRTEFLVVHQGIPDASLYDASCDGTWLLMKTVQGGRVWSASNLNDYQNSDIHNYLNGDFVNLFDVNVASKVLDVKIPYFAGTGTKGSVASGKSGLPAKFFLLSPKEMYAGTYSGMPGDGSVLDYFLPGTSASDTKRIGYSVGGATSNWWTRTPRTVNDNVAFYVFRTSGDVTYNDSVGKTPSYGLRPAFVLDSSGAIDPNTFDILG